MTALALLRTQGTHVFVATAFGDQEMARRVMRDLQARGLIITYDWTKPPPGIDRYEYQRSALGVDSLLNVLINRPNQAAADAAGVTTADVLVAIMTRDEYEYNGTWTEVGIALGAKIPVLIVSPYAISSKAKCARNLYFALPVIEHAVMGVDAFLKSL